MFYLSPKLQSLVNDQGLIPGPRNTNVREAINEAEAVAMRMLGCTLEVRGRRFILSNLELYYGGLGDHASDWFRWKFPHLSKKKVSKIHSEIQHEEGLHIYLNQKGEGNYKRMDLVIGPKDVAISLLLRGAYDENLDPLCGKNGNPNKLLKAMGIMDSDHGKEFSLKKSDLRFLDTHEKYVTNPGVQIERSKRMVGGKAIGFLDDRFGQYDWNFRLKL